MQLASNRTEQKRKFTPNLENYKTSLSYEGMVQNDRAKARSISELRRKYAR